jgi:hypothetical protein
MSKSKILSTVMADLFPNSGKVISEKLSTDEHAGFSADVQELNDRLEAQATANEQIVADLAASATQVTDLTGKLEAANTLAEGTAQKLTVVTSERDTYKAHYDAATKVGAIKAKEDEGSRGSVEMASYNASAVEVFNQAHGTK